MAGAPMDERKSVHILVAGHVQGVGFRYFVKNLAVELRVTGWVRNRFDERVEILAQGTAADLTGFISAVHIGPQAANVTELETDWLIMDIQFDRFSIAPSI